MIERHDLAGEHRRVAEGVAQHEVSDVETRRVRRDPRRRGHGLEHRVALGGRRRQVIHEGDAVEPSALGGLGPLDDGLHRHPELGEEEVELHGVSASRR